jgi:MoxR-like ATPase
MSQNMEVRGETFYETFCKVQAEINRVVVGQARSIEHLLIGVYAGGHILLTGMPGLGRTLLVKTLGTVLGLEYRRLQFTPDLLPTDIIGAEILEGHHPGGERRFRFFKGPVFANLVLADEINRSPSRTQSALLEVMQERQVTIGGQSYFMPKPFVLVATQNTLDSEGVWPLGEAQSDRFMMRIEQTYPDEASEGTMLDQTTGVRKTAANQQTTPEAVIAMQEFAREVPVVPSVKDFALEIVRASRPGQPGEVQEATRDIRLGASPRAAQAMILGAKVLALARGRKHVTKEDVIEVARPVMAHRMILDFKAQAQGRDPHQVLETLLSAMKQKSIPQVSFWTRELLKRPS